MVRFVYNEEKPEMFHKKFCLCCLYVIFALVLASNVFALNSTDIEAVRNRTLESKKALGSGDADIINSFLRAGMDELLLEQDLWESVNIRSAIIAQSGGAGMSPYGMAFIQASKKNLQVALDDVLQWEESDRKIRMELNLLIIAASLESMDMIDLGLQMLTSKNGTVQYWAVKTIANDNTRKQLISQVSGDEELVARLAKELQNIVSPQTFPETLRLIVEFCDEMDTQESKELLTKIVDIRISQYDNWKVKYELLDGILLASLGKQILVEVTPQDKSNLCRKFAQLYSFVIERFVLGQEVLRAEQKQSLASVIAEVENGPISKLLGRSQNRLKKAVEGSKYSVVESERKFLLGSDTQQGQLAKTLNFDYGKAGGNAITAPKSLKAPVVPDSEK